VVLLKILISSLFSLDLASIQYIIAGHTHRNFVFILPETFLSANPKFQTRKPPSLGSQSLSFSLSSFSFQWSFSIAFQTEPTNFDPLSDSVECEWEWDDPFPLPPLQLFPHLVCQPRRTLHGCKARVPSLERK